MERDKNFFTWHLQLVKTQKVLSSPSSFPTLWCSIVINYCKANVSNVCWADSHRSWRIWSCDPLVTRRQSEQLAPCLNMWPLFCESVPLFNFPGALYISWSCNNILLMTLEKKLLNSGTISFKRCLNEIIDDSFSYYLWCLCDSTFQIHESYLYPQHQMSIGMFKLLLTTLQLLGPLLFPLQLPDVVHWRLEDGAFVPAHVPENNRGAIIL